MADRECEQRVAKMEEVYNRCAAGTRALQEALQGWEGNLNDFFALMEYYGSEEWYKDREACAGGELPPDLPCGVLGEDTVYDLYGDMRGIVLDMLEAALRWLRKEG